MNKLITYQQQSSTEAVRCDLLNEGEFRHICLIAKRTCSLDDSSTKNINQLIAIAIEYINTNNSTIQALCNDLVSNCNQEQEMIDNSNHGASGIQAVEKDSTVNHFIHHDNNNILDIVDCNHQLLRELNTTNHIAITRKCGQEFIKHLHDYYTVILGNVTINNSIEKYASSGEEGYTLLLEDLQLCCIKLCSIPIVDWLIQDEDFDPVLILNYAIYYYYESLVANPLLEAEIKPIINNILTHIDEYWITPEDITEQRNLIMEYPNEIIRAQILNYFDSTLNVEYNHINNNHDMSMEDDSVSKLGDSVASIAQ